MHDINPYLAFVYPEEGVNIFVDAMCIPRTAQNVDAALKYINFMLDPEIGLSNAWYIGYASPNTAVVAHPDYADYAENQLLYPDEDHMPNVEYFHNLPQETLNHFSELWNQIKMAGGTDKTVYIGFGITAAVIVGYLVYQFILKRRRNYWYDFPKT
jgi:spermidine/putrescine transport system substrate-binding protein